MDGAIPKVATRIPGFDYVTIGGLPKGRSTLVAGRLNLESQQPSP